MGTLLDVADLLPSVKIKHAAQDNPCKGDMALWDIWLERHQHCDRVTAGAACWESVTSYEQSLIFRCFPVGVLTVGNSH